MMNQRKVILYIAQSVDGYIATKEDSVDWLFKFEGESDNGYTGFYDTVDTVFLGNRTYDWIMENSEDGYPYKDKAGYVFTRSCHADTEDVKFINEDITGFVRELKQREGKDIWLVGGATILHTFLQENLVDELLITMVPTLLGEGISLFSEGDYQLDFTLKGTRTFNQFVELHYILKQST